MAYSAAEFLLDHAAPSDEQPSSTEKFTAEDFLRQAQDAADLAPPPPTPPKTWGSELTHAFGRGVDQLQQMGHGVGALSFSWLGWEGAKDFFLKGYKANEEQLRLNPTSVPTYENIDGFDSAIRYGLSAVGSLAPQVGESVVTGVVGAALGSAAEPVGGTIAGGVAGMVAKRSVRKLLANEVEGLMEGAVKTELSSYLEGKITRDALGAAAQAFATDEMKQTAKKYGVNAAIALSSIGKETGSIYGDMIDNPNISESDRRVAATIGGVIAAIPDTVVGSYIAGKFFPGAAKVPKDKLAEAAGFWTRVLKEGGKEMAKVAPMEGSQELVQTSIEVASRLWADPATRDNFLTFNHQQWAEVIDSTLQGTLGGGVFGGGIATVGQMATAHPSKAVSDALKDIYTKTQDRIKSETVVVSPEVNEYAELDQKIESLKAQRPTATPEVAADIDAQLATLTPRHAELEMVLFPDAEAESGGATTTTAKAPEPEPLVNQNPPIAGPALLDAKGNKLAEGTIGQTHADLKSEALGKLLESDPEADPFSIVHGFRDTNGAVMSRTEAAQRALDNQQITQAQFDEMMARKEPGLASQDLLPSSIPAPVAAPKTTAPLPTTDSALISNLRAFYAQRMGTRNVYERNIPDIYEQAREKQKEVHTHIDSITSSYLDSDKGKAYNAALKAAFTPDVITMMAAEGVNLKTGRDEESKDDDVHFAAIPQRDGSINLHVPSAEEFFSEATRKESNAAQAETDYLSNVGKVMGHEIIHVADLIGIRDNWKQSKSRKGFSSYAVDVWTSRGSVAREAMPDLPAKLKSAYNYGAIGRMSDMQVGQELSRAMIEMARSGTLTETTEALASAARSNGKIDMFVRVWIKAIMDIGEAIKKFFNPETAPAEVVQAYEQINQVLDKYGVMVTPEVLAEQEQMMAVNRSREQEAKDLEKSQADDAAREQAASQQKEEERKNSEAAAIAKTEPLVTREPESSPGTQSVETAPQPPTLHQLFRAAIKTGDETQIINTWLDYSKSKGFTPTTQSGIAASYRDLDNRLPQSVVVSRKKFNDIVKERNSILVNQTRNKSKTSNDDRISALHQRQEELSKILKHELTLEAIGDSGLRDGLIEKDSDLQTEMLEDFEHFNQRARDKKNEVEKMEREFTRNAIELYELTRGTTIGYAASASAVSGYGYTNRFLESAYQKSKNLVNQKPAANAARKAPNGQPSNLTEFQWNQVRTPQFKSWFGDWENDKENASKVVDENGEPKVVYHGTTAPEFEEFDPNKIGRSGYPDTKVGLAYFFSTDGATAHYVANSTLESGTNNEGQARLIPSYLNIKNPLTWNPEKWGKDGSIDTEEVAKLIIHARDKMKFDGLIYESSQMGDTMVVFNPNQIKSAILNSGEFSLTSNAIARAARKGLSQADEEKIASISNRVSKNFSNEPIKVSRSRKEQRGNMPDYDTMTAQDMEYKSQPQGDAIIKANMVFDMHGMDYMVASLLKDPLGREFDLNEQDEVDGTPNAVLNALHGRTRRQLDAVLGVLRKQGASGKLQAYVADTIRQLEVAFRPIGLAPGRFGAISGRFDKVWNGYVARRDYIDPIIAHLEKVLGKKYGSMIQELADSLNDLVNQHIGRAVGRPQMMQVLSDLHKDVHTRKFQDKLRKTFAKNESRMRRAAGRAAARMAEYVGMDELGQEWGDKAAKLIVKEMSGIPKSTEGPSEVDIFSAVVRRVARDNANELGLIPETKSPKPPTVAEQFSAILKNPDLYNTFVNSLVNQIQATYKPEPGTAFAQQVQDFEASMANRQWSEGLIESLIAEKLREYETNIQKIAAKNYGATAFEVSRLKSDIKAYMQNEGIENEALLDNLVADIDASMTSQIEEARLNILGSNKGVKSFLSHIQSTLAEKAREHASASQFLDQDLATWLENEIGLPDTMSATIADVMQHQLNDMVQDEREKIIQRWMDSALVNQKSDSKKRQAVDKLLELANVGVFRREDVYRALQDKFDLPPFDPDTAAEAESLGDKVGNASNDRVKDIYKQRLVNLLEGQKGISTYDMYLSAYYTNILSGPSTHLVNLVSNSLSLFGYYMVNAVQNPRAIGRMTRALFRTMTGSALVEAKESFFTGVSLAKTGNKFFKQTALELDSPKFESKRTHEWAKKADVATAEWLHKVYRGVKGNYVGRALVAADIFFYKLAQEQRFAATTGIEFDPEMFASARQEASSQLEALGEDITTRDNRLKLEALAHRIYADERLKVGGMESEDLRLAYVESHVEALDATFNQDPKGILGKLAKMIEKFTENNPIGKLLIPFTKIAANVTNQMLEWTPYGYVRFSVGHMFAEDFRTTDELGEVTGRDAQIAIRATLGTMGMIALMMLLGEQDPDDPYIEITADGPRDLERKRQMMDRGWRPNTIKVGNSYFSYAPTPFAVAFSIIGRMFDDYKDGKITQPSMSNISMSSSVVAMLRSIVNQSFLASTGDLMSAVDSPDPEKKISRLFSRMATAPFIPNLAKQVDKWVDPSIQESDGFRESVIKEIPVARSLVLNSMINVFGHDIKRTPGLGFMPGMERFITMEKSDDPVMNFLGEKQLKVPGFSKSTKLGNTPMDRETFYSYVREAGPQIEKAIQAEIPRLRQMTKEDAQERIEEIASAIKSKVRAKLRLTIVN